MPGADPQTMASSVATPLEQQFEPDPRHDPAHLVQRARRDRSSPCSSSSSRTVDSAATDVLAAINAASPFLPPNIPYPPTIRKVNPAETPIMLIALTSDSLPLTTVDAYAENILLPKISQIPGVGLVGIGGQQKPADPRPGQPAGAGRPRHRPRGRPQRDRRRQCRPAQGHAQQPAQSPTRSTPTTSC